VAHRSGYCPYCAAQNWALIVALSRFGSFSGLSTVRTYHYDNTAPIDGWMFYGSSFTSKYLTFVPVETDSNTLVSATANSADKKSYRPLQRLTSAQQAVFSQYDATRAVPFLDFGNKAVVTGSDLDPSAITGKPGVRSPARSAIRATAPPRRFLARRTCLPRRSAISRKTGRPRPARAPSQLSSSAIKTLELSRTEAARLWGRNATLKTVDSLSRHS
jgi:hypothetical protein